MNNNLMVVSNCELEDVNGGGIGLIVGGLLIAGGTLVGDYILDKQTGKNAVQWVGTGLSTAGKALQNVGDALMN